MNKFSFFKVNNFFNLKYNNIETVIKSTNKNNQDLSIQHISLADVPLAWGLYFQDGASPSIEGIIDLHDRIMFYLVIILFGVSWVMFSIMWNFNNKSADKFSYKYMKHGTLIELIWTVGPALVLIAIAFPSFKLLYLMDEVIDPAMTLKITGFLNYIYSFRIVNIYKGGLKLYVLYKCNYTLYFNLLIRVVSIVPFHTYVKSKNRIGPHDKDVISIIIGSLLGDCYGSKRYAEGTRFIFKQSVIHKDYLFWLYNSFFSKGYCSKLKPRLYTRKLKWKDEIK